MPLAAAPSAMRAAPVFRGSSRPARVRGAFGEQAHRVTLGERPLHRGEHLGVARGIDARVGPAVDRDRARAAHEPTDERHREQRRLGEEPGLAPRGRDDQRRVEQAVRVVGDQQQRARRQRVANAIHPVEEASRTPAPDAALDVHASDAARLAASTPRRLRPRERGPPRSAAAPRWPSGTFTIASRIAPTTKNTITERMAFRLEPVVPDRVGEDRGPDDAGELLEHREEAEELGRLLLGDHRREQRAAERLAAALHHADQERQQVEVRASTS